MKLLINIQNGTVEVSCPIFSVSFTMAEIDTIFNSHKYIISKLIGDQMLYKLEVVVPVIKAYASLLGAIDATQSINIDKDGIITMESQGKATFHVDDMLNFKTLLTNLTNQ